MKLQTKRQIIKWIILALGFCTVIIGGFMMFCTKEMIQDVKFGMVGVCIFLAGSLIMIGEIYDTK